MKLKFDLYEITEKEKQASVTRSFEFRPTLKQYREDVVFKVKGANSEQIMDNLKLPNNVGDSVLLEMTKKDEQTELPGKGENGKKKGSGASKAGK